MLLLRRIQSWVKLAEEAEHLRELLALTVETYLSYSANRTSEVMRVPAVITTIFLPLTLVAGIYGIIVGMVRAGFGPARPPAQNKRRLEF